MPKIVFALVFIFTFSPHSHAATMVDIVCNKGQLVLARGLQEGPTKSSAKNASPPSAIYFDLEIEKFVSNQFKKSSYIDLSYFVNGKLLLPQCKGSAIEATNAGFKD